MSFQKKVKLVIMGNGESFVSSMIIKNIIKLSPKLNFEIIAIIDDAKNHRGLLIKYLSFLVYKIFNPFEGNRLSLYPHFSYYTKEVTIIKSEDINSKDFLKIIEELGADYAFVIGVGHIMKTKLISRFKKVLNYHNSYLPECGGLYATSWEMYHGYERSGFSYHYIEDESIDTGNIILQKKIVIDKHATPLQNEFTKTLEACDYLESALKMLFNEKTGSKQEGGTYFGIKEINDIRKLDSLENIEETHKKIHCFNYVNFNSEKVTKISNEGVVKRIFYLPVFVYQTYMFFKKKFFWFLKL